MDEHEFLENEMAETRRALVRGTEHVRALNDKLRKRNEGGIVVITGGVAELGATTVSRILRATSAFDDFTSENDPYGEHDCAIVEVDGIKIIWKIDYYDKRRQHRSPDNADPRVTTRVMTVMRADEY